VEGIIFLPLLDCPRKDTIGKFPFVKCDSRQCDYDGEEAYQYCVYPILAVAPKEAGDTGGMERAEQFKAYIEGRYPQLLDPDLTHFPNGYAFVQIFESNDAIENYVTDKEYGITGKEQIGLAIVFEGKDELEYKYSIRANSTNFNAPEEEGRPATYTSPNTQRNFESYAREDTACTPLDGTPYQGPMERSCTGLYIYNGFLTLQRLVHDWIMEETQAADAGYFVSEHGVNYVPFPTREYEEKGFYGELAEYMPVLMTLGILYPCAAMISYIVQEKELRQKELMKMMSVTELEIGWSWFFSFFLLHFWTAAFVTLITADLFQNSDGILLFIFWEMCFLGFIVLSMLISTLVAKTTRGVLFGLLAVFGGFFLTLAVDVEDGSSSLIGLLSLHPVAAMSYALQVRERMPAVWLSKCVSSGVLLQDSQQVLFSLSLQEVGRLEDQGIGVTADSIGSTDAPSGYTFNNAYVNLFWSSVFLGILTWYFNRVIPPGYGQAMPFYFPFTKAYWCPGKGKHEVDASDEALLDETVPVEGVTENLRQQAKNGENIEIKNLRKSFKEKVAVDGLNLSIYNGQITALLGHNGGKCKMTPVTRHHIEITWSNHLFSYDF
jgi:ATP-binding cassette subfamily A (ABC1) protein 3